MFESVQFEASNERRLEGKSLVFTSNKIYGCLGGSSVEITKNWYYQLCCGNIASENLY